jgi:hypothetical protein
VLSVISEADRHEIEQRRRAARRTAWKLAIVALIIFGLFVLRGVIGR